MKKLRIVFVGMSGKFSATALLQLVKKHEIICIIEGASRVSANRKAYNLVFQFLAESYAKVSRRNISMTLRRLAKKYGIKYFYVKDLNSKKVESMLIQINPDLICIASASQLLKKRIIRIPEFGVVNLHPSYLPYYKGPNPWFWHYYYMEKEPGVTVHFIDEGEDTGSIICQAKYCVDLGDSFSLVHEKASKLGAELLVKAVNAIATGKVESFQQPVAPKEIRAGRVNPNEKYVKWSSWSVERVYHFLVGTSSWVNSLGQLPRGFSWYIHEYQKYTDNSGVKPGQVYHDKDKIYVQCKDGRILLSKKFSLKQFLKSFI